MNPIIRKRLKFLRDKNKWTQEHLSTLLDFNDRQTISAIESGHRRISAEELVKASQVFGVDLGFFTDPYRLVEDARFSWRQDSTSDNSLADFEDRAGRWIATYRELRKLKDEKQNPLLPRIGLTANSTFEDAMKFGEIMAETLNLGAAPAISLQNSLEEKLKILILHVDANVGISGAACQLPELNAVLINRSEPRGRRHFDLAHELFHLLTWDALPPKHLESKRPAREEKRIEQLAECFASALLMPSNVLDNYLSSFDKTKAAEWLNETSIALAVSAVALKWRLVNLGMLHKDDVNDLHLRQPAEGHDERPHLYSKDFLSTLSWGISEGHVSVRWIANLLDLTVDNLSELFAQYNLESPFDL